MPSLTSPLFDSLSPEKSSLSWGDDGAADNEGGTAGCWDVPPLTLINSTEIGGKTAEGGGVPRKELTKPSV